MKLQLYLNDELREVISDQKNRYRNGSCSHVPSETSKHRPPAALKLGSEDSQRYGAFIHRSGDVIRALRGEEPRR